MRILVCPLDWGLGHAARCIPLIRALRAAGHEVRIGAAGGGLRLLRAEFPGLDVFDFPGYRVRYSRSPAFFLPVMLAQMPRVLAGMLSESRRLKAMLASRPCDLIVSDGRYGVFSSAVPTVFITHQVFIRVPGRFPGAGLIENLLLALNLRLLQRFDRVWVPDFPGSDSLSGDLSHKPSGLGNLEFIGPLSRFSGTEEPGPGTGEKGRSAEDGLPKIDVLAVVSGPEPQRGLFEAALRKELEAAKGTRVLVQGLPGAASVPGLDSLRPDAFTVFPHLPGRDLSRLFSSADLIVARSGYTTVMELAALESKAVVLVPTPGQSEQEYLADHLERCGAAVKQEQHGLDLPGAKARLQGAAGFARWRTMGTSGSGNGFSLAGFLAAHPLLREPRARKTSLDVQKSRQQ